MLATGYLEATRARSRAPKSGFKSSLITSTPLLQVIAALRENARQAVHRGHSFGHPGGRGLMSLNGMRTQRCCYIHALL
jgi:hypothetical protein